MPMDRGAIDAQLREIGEGERWWEQREFRDLPHMLHADERIQGLATGKLLGARRLRLWPSSSWLFVATNQRLLCLKQERFARRQVDITPGQVIRVSQGNRLRSYQINLETPARKFRLRIPKADAFRFAAAIEPFLPRVPERKLHPDLEPLAWIPGFTRVANLPGLAGVVSTVSKLSPPDPEVRGRDYHVERLEATVERLQTDVEQLQEKVAFLENLLLEQTNKVALSPWSADVKL
jgi:hypothetical protein